MNKYKLIEKFRAQVSVSAFDLDDIINEKDSKLSLIKKSIFKTKTCI